MSPTPPWMPESPESLTEDYYQSHTSLEDVDSGMWTYLCNLIPADERPYKVRVAEMLASASPELRRYYLARGFDWERGSGGLESCLMNDPENDHHFVEDTIKAYEELGAFKHAAIIRELVPLARNRQQQITEAEAQGREFNFDDDFWEPYEARWDAASEEFDFYEVIWKDIETHPGRYTHPR